MGKEARARTREMRAQREAEAARQKRRQQLVTWIGGLVVLALVVAIGVLVYRAATSDDGGAGAGAGGAGSAPANLTDTEAIPVGAEDAPVTLEVYFDYMCPACGQFEAANSGEVEQLVEAGDVQVQLRPLSFLDQTSQGAEFSTRAANALATVADGAPDQVWDFHTAMFDQQPEEGTTGLSDEEIATIAADAGVPDEVVARFEDREYDGWVADVTQEAFDSGVTGTPTLKIDGEVYEGDMYTPGPLTDALEAAAQDAG